MTTLATLSADCLANVLDYLDGDAVITLLGTRNRMLLQKVSYKVKALFFDTLPGTKFPISALSLPIIRSLQVISTNPNITYVDYGKDLKSKLVNLTSPISSLEMDFRNSSALLTMPGFQNAFPSLTKLSAKSFKCNAETIDAFGSLPETLKTLELHSIFAGVASRIMFEDIAKLPRSISSLDLRWAVIEGPTLTGPLTDELVGQTFASILPPNLTSMTLHSLIEYRILEHLPPDLVQLSLKFGEIRSYELRSSFFPKKLTSASITTSYGGNVRLVFDEPLPRSLINLELPRSCSDLILSMGNRPGTSIPQDILNLEAMFPNLGDLPPKIDILPPNLEVTCSSPTCSLFSTFTLTPDDLTRRSTEMYQKFTRIRSLSIFHTSQFEILKSFDPGYPVSLKCELDNVVLVEPLPSSIQRLLMRKSLRPDNIRFFPRKLKELSFMQEGREVPDPWTQDHLRQLPRSLNILKISMSVIKEGRILRPISDLFLEEFQLVTIPVSEVKKLPEWFPQCLPRTLVTLKVAIEYVSVVLRQDPTLPISLDSVRLCNLGEVVPRLEMLDLAFIFNDDAPLGPTLASLPMQVRELNFGNLSSHFETSALSFLPPSVISVSIYLDTNLAENSTRVLTNEHFERLPSKISYFFMHRNSSYALDAKILLVLPKSLTEFFISNPFQTEHDNKDCGPQISEFLKHRLQNENFTPKAS